MSGMTIILQGAISIAINCSGFRTGQIMFYQYFDPINGDSYPKINFRNPDKRATIIYMLFNIQS